MSSSSVLRAASGLLLGLLLSSLALAALAEEEMLPNDFAIADSLPNNVIIPTAMALWQDGKLLNDYMVGETLLHDSPSGGYLPGHGAQVIASALVSVKAVAETVQKESLRTWHSAIAQMILVKGKVARSDTGWMSLLLLLLVGLVVVAPPLFAYAASQRHRRGPVWTGRRDSVEAPMVPAGTSLIFHADHNVEEFTMRHEEMARSSTRPEPGGPGLGRSGFSGHVDGIHFGYFEDGQTGHTQGQQGHTQPIGESQKHEDGRDGQSEPGPRAPQT